MAFWVCCHQLPLPAFFPPSSCLSVCLSLFLSLSLSVCVCVFAQKTHHHNPNNHPQMDQCMDCLLSWLCGPCAAGQNHLEAREFGYEPEVVAANKDKAEEKGKLSGEEKNKE